MQLPACDDEIANVTVNCIKYKQVTNIMKPCYAVAKLMIEAWLFILETTLRFKGDKEHQNLMLKMYSGKQISNCNLQRLKVLANKDLQSNSNNSDTFSNAVVLVPTNREYTY